MKSYVEEYGVSSRELVERAAYELVSFTYNQIANYLYSKGYRVKLETIKRIVRRMKEEGLLKECGVTKKGAKIWCLTAQAVSIPRGGKELVRGW